MVCYENFVKVKNKAIFYSWKSNKSSVTINNTCGVGVLFVRACTCKLVYIRRKLMCNFVQLLGNVCWCHTATWRVSNETDIKAAKKMQEALFVVFIIYNTSAYIVNMRNDF